MTEQEKIARRRERCAKYDAEHREERSRSQVERLKRQRAMGTLPPSKQPEYLRAYNKRRYETDPEVRAKMKAASQRWVEKNRHLLREKARVWRAKQSVGGVSNGKRLKLRNKYGITVEEYNARVRAVGGRCQACGNERPLNVDHAHDDGHVRGMLCGECNRAIGLLGDSLPGVEGALRYLQAYL